MGDACGCDWRVAVGCWQSTIGKVSTRSSESGGQGQGKMSDGWMSHGFRFVWKGKLGPEVLLTVELAKGLLPSRYSRVT